MAHIGQRYFQAHGESEVKAPSRSTRLEQQQAILKLFDYGACDGAAKVELELKALRIAMLSAQRDSFFKRYCSSCYRSASFPPATHTFRIWWGGPSRANDCAITHLLGRTLTPEMEERLAALLEADEGMYRISLLKHEPKDFSYGELRQEVERRKFFQPLFAFDQSFLPAAGLSNESVKYYASLVQFYTVYKLQRMALPTARLYLLCFASHRYRQINDNLIEAFIHLVDQYEQQAKLASEIAAAEAMMEASGNLKAAGQVLDLFLDPSIADWTPFSKVRQQAFSLLDSESFSQVSEYMRKIEFDKASFEWSYYGNLHAKFKLNLRHLFSNVDFAGLVEDAPLLEAVRFLQTLMLHGRSPRQANPADFPAASSPKGFSAIYIWKPASGRTGVSTSTVTSSWSIACCGRLLRAAMSTFGTATVPQLRG